MNPIDALFYTLLYAYIAFGFGYFLKKINSTLKKEK